MLEGLSLCCKPISCILKGVMRRVGEPMYTRERRDGRGGMAYKRKSQ